MQRPQPEDRIIELGQEEQAELLLLLRGMPVYNPSDRDYQEAAIACLQHWNEQPLCIRGLLYQLLLEGRARRTRQTTAA